MPVSVPEFWKLLVESRLATVEQLQPLQGKFATVKGADTQGNSSTLSEWLVANGVISRYQAKVLTAGRPGPFRFGDYVVYDRHDGPFKGVFKAIHPPTRHQVVLSFFTGQATQNPHWWSIIVQQMAVLSRAMHPNLCRVFQLCDTGSYKFAVLEYIRGQSVAERLTGGSLRWPEACRIVRQTALGLVRLLEVGQLHGEVRPANVWIDRQENAKLLLPPLARDPLAMPGPINFAASDPVWLATVADYLAPEMSQPGQSPNASTDVYALGCTLFQLIAGQPPFGEGDVATKLHRHAAETLPSLESLGVPPLVSHILASMTAKNPALRYQHPQLVVDALSGILQQFDATQLALPASPIPPTQATFETWLQEQPIVPSISHGPTPPVVVGAGSNGAEPDAMPTIVPMAMPAMPLSVGSVAATGFDPIAAMAATATAPVIEPSFAFDDFAPRPSQLKHDADAMFAASLEAGESASKVTEMVRGRRSRQRRALLKIIGGLALCAIVGGGAYWFADYKQRAPSTTENTVTSETENPDASQTLESDASNQTNASDTGAQALVADDGITLWTSPTVGSVWSMEYVAPAPQVLMFFRPAELVKHAEGEKLLAAVGPRGEAARRELESVVGPLADIESLTIAWADPLTIDSTGAGGWPLAPMYVIRYSVGREIESLAKKWGDSPAIKEGAEQVYQTTLGSAFFPSKAQRRTLVIGSANQIKEVIKQAGKAPPIRLELERLLRATDDRRLATLLLVPDIALSHGSTIFKGPFENLIAPAREFIGENCRGAELSAHLMGDSLFLEMRLLNSFDAKPDVAADQTKQQLEKLPESVERFVVSLNAQPYGRFMLRRFPDMVKLLKEFTRVGSEDNQTVLRSYLPAAAAHNLALGAELALAENAGLAQAGTLAANNASGGGTGAATQSVAERLTRKTSLNFARDTLEKALIMLAEDIGVPIEIIGGDLQLEGITKNQSFGLDERDKPANEILRNIMLKANPDGKLVYVIKRHDPSGEETLFITTRAAAAKRGDKLPAELEK